MTAAPTPSFEPRAVCMRCRRPARVCYCRHLTSLDTATRVVLLQHPRERDVAIGTARMASLCLPNSELHVGVSFEASPELDRALSDPSRPAALLYPGEGAIDVGQSPPAGPITLVVVDGTWWQAKKLVRENPRIAALPRYAFVPPGPSEYRIRREPQDDYVSTIEALVHVLGVLEGDADRFTALLAPFRAMIDAQIDHQQRLHGARVRRANLTNRKAWRPNVPRLLGERAADLLCVYGEANAWPYRIASRSPLYADELVQWVACRPSSGEIFESVLAPRRPLGPHTLEYTGLEAEQLANGAGVAEVLARWNAFVRPSDVVCSWGHYARSLFVEAGGALPAAHVDLRHVARVYEKGPVGALEELAARLPGGAAATPFGAGRAGLRLGQLVAITRHFTALSLPGEHVRPPRPARK